MKRIFTIAAAALAVLCSVCVFVVGGQAGAYAWNLAVFILAPAAVLLLLPQLVFLLWGLFRHRQIAGNLAALAVTLLLALPITVLFGLSPVCYPDTAAPGSAVTMTMPVENGVLFGGADYRSHAMWPSERYAYDIVCDPHNTGSSSLTDYGIFNAEVYAPVNGTVLAAKDDEADIQPGSDIFQSSLGNYLFLQIDETGTYVILAHLEKDSISVQTGDHITAGMPIARVGNSGTTSEPHLHLQHQQNDPRTMRFPSCAVGLPIEF